MNKYFSGNEGYDTAPYMIEIHGVGDPQDSWVSNALRFDTPQAADDYGSELSSRWFGMDKYRVIPVKLSELLKNKRKGLDCTEEESAEIKGWLRDNMSSDAMGELYIRRDIERLFPAEYGEFIEEPIK